MVSGTGRGMVRRMMPPLLFGLACLLVVIVGLLLWRAGRDPRPPGEVPEGVILVPMHEPATPTASPTVASPTPTPSPEAMSPETTDVVDLPEISADDGTDLRQAIATVVQVRTRTGTGTGIIVDLGDGRRAILTNEHVVRNRVQITVVTADGIEHPADLLRAGTDVDLALLLVEGFEARPVASWGELTDLAPGDPLYVVGYALGTELWGDPTVTRGILSGRRMIHGVEYLQTDAAMNPGNSGGPVLDAEGRVVGIATMVIREHSGTAIEGLNFAIAADVARAFVEREAG